MRASRRSFLQKTSAFAAATVLRRSTGAQTGQSSSIALDPLRPSCHLLPPHNWMNDPNGPIWWKGKYHLFYQLNPHAAVWGDMHWGHATSTDMVHWQHQPIALTPTPGGADSEGCFSGSAIVHNGVPTIIYTGVQNAPPAQVTLRDGNDKLRETQMLAVADGDDILRWNKLEQPVIATPPPGMKVTGFRDPCPWKEEDGWYVGVGSGERGKGGCVLLYRSQDLRKWEYLHPLAAGIPNGRQAANPCDSAEMWECPDFFALGNQHYLHYSTENKVIWTTGNYDRVAHTFSPKRRGVLDHGAYYAPKTFLAPDGRRILWGWIRETRPEAQFAAAGWSGCMSLPRVLSVGAQGQLEMHPASEVLKLRGPEDKATIKNGQPFRRTLAELRQELYVPVDFTISTATVRLLVGGNEVWKLSINIPGDSVHCGDTSFPLPQFPWPRPALHLFLDGSVIESFIGGREAMTSRVYSIKPAETELEVSVAGKGQGHVDVSLWPLKPISPDQMTS
jgi:beta-fructofuranosidase